VRSWEEYIDIFDLDPRPVSVLLADGEVVLLAQNGNHALEKVLDGGAKDNVNLERAVRIRRALFCESLLILWSFRLFMMMAL
jgi:hypothetical protein